MQTQTQATRLYQLRSYNVTNVIKKKRKYKIFYQI